jgi:hypothetical protein
MVPTPPLPMVPMVVLFETVPPPEKMPPPAKMPPPLPP